MGLTGPIDYDVADDTFPALDSETQPVATLVDEALRTRPDDVEVVTFGCRLNAYESEAIRARAAEAGLEDTVIVNTFSNERPPGSVVRMRML